MEDIEAIEVSGYSINKNLTITNKDGDVMIFQLTKDYPTVELTVLGERKRYWVHRLFATKFVPNPNNLPVVNHIDFNRGNYHPSNLEWLSAWDSVKHSMGDILAAHCTVMATLKDPEGNYHQISQIRKWCKYNNYPYSSVAMLINGRRKTWKGWTLVSKVSHVRQGD